MPDTPEGLAAWARGIWPGGDPGPLESQPIAADGSPRLFTRLRAGGISMVAMSADHHAENLAWLTLARHLAGLGLPVARVLAADLAGGRFLMEDLGSLSLQEAALALGRDENALLELYRPVLGVLARLQAQGARGLDLGVCFDGPALSPEFLLLREAGYFLGEFVEGACGRGPGEWPEGLLSDLARLSLRAGRALPQGLVHRDFQSRNVMVGPAGPGLVDFQGARLGPAQYDLASLLYDPYLDLGDNLRLRLRALYLEFRFGLGGLDEKSFLNGWPFVAASRLMQALGAYAFLTRRRGRAHFAAYASPALASLRRLARAPEMAGLRAWRRLLDLLPQELGPEMFRPLPQE